MKGVFTFILISVSTCILAQTRVAKPEPIRVRSENGPILTEQRHGENTSHNLQIFGDFTILKYEQIGVLRPNQIDLDLLIGSFVKIQESSITGEEIAPMSFIIYETEQMASDDYIFRVFGEKITGIPEDLPPTVKVFKTDHRECYGIVDLGSKGIAIPYEGMLLFLKRR